MYKNGISIQRIMVICSAAVVIAACFYACILKTKSINNELALIEKVMLFPLHNITKRCQKDHGYDDSDILLLEKELKRFFILGMIKETKNMPLGMYSKHVDNLWHTFILFTKEYQDFCNGTAGYFIHHVPELNTDNRTSEEHAKMHTRYRTFIEMYEKVFKEQVNPIWLFDSVE